MSQLKRKRVKRFKQPAWINDEILAAIEKRDQDLKKARKSNAVDDWAQYKLSKCWVVNLIKKSKRSYFQEKIENNKGNPKGIWNALKLLTKAQKSNEIIELKKESSLSETNALEMAHMLNDFFVNIATQMRNDQISTDPLDTKKIDEFVSTKSTIVSHSSTSHL